METQLCDFCGTEKPTDTWQVCATCDEEMCEVCLETHECEAPDDPA